MSSSIDWNLEYTKTITREQSYKTFDCGNFLPLHNYTIILCFKKIWLQLLPFNGSKLPWYCYITQNGSITLTTVSNTMVIYCRILTLERVSTTVNYCDIVYSIGPKEKSLYALDIHSGLSLASWDRKAFVGQILYKSYRLSLG